MPAAFGTAAEWLWCGRGKGNKKTDVAETTADTKMETELQELLVTVGAVAEE